MSLFIEFLHAEDEPLGPAFVSYSRQDAPEVREIVGENLTAHGLPYFLDEKDIQGGSKPVEELEEAIRRACVGILVLSDASIRSQWVFFEAGLLVGFKKRLVPFVLDAATTQDLLDELPDFLRQYQIVHEVDDLVALVQEAQSTYYDLFDDRRANRRIVTRLRQVKLSLTLSVPKDLVPHLHFGALVVRFGIEETLRHPANASLAEEGQLVNRSLVARAVHLDESSGEVRVRYVLPLHRTLGLQFKLFVDVADPELVEPAIEVLRTAGMEEVSRSQSGQRSRLYCLLPEGRLVVTQTPEGIRNNFVYPE